MTTTEEYRQRMWRKKPRPLCPKAYEPPSPCDCGYVGEWMFRLWRHRGAGGHELIGGWEECCPRCGDVEVFRLADGALVEQIRNPKFTGPRNHTLDDDPLTLLDDE